jgi:hypothetical protein
MRGIFASKEPCGKNGIIALTNENFQNKFIPGGDMRQFVDLMVAEICGNIFKIKYCDSFTLKINLNNIISDKFPDHDLKINKIIVVNTCCNYFALDGMYCIISESMHDKPSMYIEVIKDLMIVKCNDLKCFGKSSPYEHIRLSQYETNIIFNNAFTKNTTLEQKIEYSPYLCFLDECTEHCNTPIKSTDLYANFKIWYNMYKSGDTLPSNRKFASEVQNYKIYENIRFNDGQTTTGIKNLRIKV